MRKRKKRRPLIPLPSVEALLPHCRAIGPSLWSLLARAAGAQTVQQITALTGQPIRTIQHQLRHLRRARYLNGEKLTALAASTRAILDARSPRHLPRQSLTPPRSRRPPRHP